MSTRRASARLKWRYVSHRSTVLGAARTASRCEQPARSAAANPETAARRLGDTPAQAAAYVRQVGEDAHDPIPLARAHR